MEIMLLWNNYFVMRKQCFIFIKILTYWKIYELAFFLPKQTAISHIE